MSSSALEEMRFLLAHPLSACLLLIWTSAVGQDDLSETTQKLNGTGSNSRSGDGDGGNGQVPKHSESTLIIILSIAAFTLIIVLVAVLCFVYRRMMKAEKIREQRRAFIRARAKAASAELLATADDIPSLGSSQEGSDTGNQTRKAMDTHRAMVHFSESDTVWDPQSPLHIYRKRKPSHRNDLHKLSEHRHMLSNMDEIPKRKMTPFSQDESPFASVERPRDRKNSVDASLEKYREEALRLSADRRRGSGTPISLRDLPVPNKRPSHRAVTGPREHYEQRSTNRHKGSQRSANDRGSEGSSSEDRQRLQSLAKRLHSAKSESDSMISESGKTNESDVYSESASMTSRGSTVDEEDREGADSDDGSGSSVTSFEQSSRRYSSES